MKEMESDWSEKFDEYFGGPDDMIQPRKVIRLIWIFTICSHSIAWNVRSISYKEEMSREPWVGSCEDMEANAASGKNPDKVWLSYNYCNIHNSYNNYNNIYNDYNIFLYPYHFKNTQIMIIISYFFYDYDDKSEYDRLISTISMIVMMMVMMIMVI